LPYEEWIYRTIYHFHAKYAQAPIAYDHDGVSGITFISIRYAKYHIEHVI